MLQTRLTIHESRILDPLRVAGHPAHGLELLLLRRDVQQSLAGL